MKKNFLPVVLFLFLTSIIYLNCENATETTYGDSNIKGFVVDSITRAPLDSVYIYIPDVPLSGYTGPTGYYQFLNIHMPRPKWGCQFNFSKNGYVSKTFWADLFGSDTTIVNVGLLHN